jgi:hypothetical protein
MPYESDDIFGGSGREPSPGTKGIDNAALEEAIEALLGQGTYRSSFRSGATEVQVTATLTGNNREWKSRLAATQGGQPVDEPWESKISRSPDDARRVARMLATRYFEACRLQRERISTGERKSRWPALAFALVIVLGLGIVLAYGYSRLPQLEDSARRALATIFADTSPGDSACRIDPSGQACQPPIEPKPPNTVEPDRPKREVPDPKPVKPPEPRKPFEWYFEEHGG